MWVETSNTHAHVIRTSDAERDWIREYLAFPDARAFFRPGDGDKRIRMFDEFGSSFPAGLVGLVRQAIKKPPPDGCGSNLEVIDKRSSKPPLEPDPDLEWLRDYQREAVDKAITRERGILWLPTGAGKTEIATAIVRAIEGPWVFLVHSKQLGFDTAARFENRNREHGVDLGRAGVIGEGRWEVGPRFTCATFQTLARKLAKNDPKALHLVRSARGIIVDECHTLPADSFYNVAQSFENAYYRFGLSGTPLARGDRKSVLAIATLGPVIHRVKATFLIEQGIIAKPKIRLATLYQAPHAVTWDGVYGESVVRSTARNKTILDMVKRAEKPCFVFVKEIAHGRQLARQIQLAGIPCDFVWGGKSVEIRKRKIAWMLREGHAVLVCNVVFQEGIDVPGLRSVIVASGGKSAIAAIQRIGRGMRIEKDAAGNVIKDTFEVWDVNDTGPRDEHGKPGWLEKHARDRRNAYVAEGYEVIVEP